MGRLEILFPAVAGVVGGFISTLASNVSAVTLPALELPGLPEHVANGTNRLSVVALGLVGAVSFYLQGLVDWRKGTWIAVLVALGTTAGSLIAVEPSDTVLDGIISMGLLLVLGCCFCSVCRLRVMNEFEAAERAGGVYVALVDPAQCRTTLRVGNEGGHLDVLGERDVGLEHYARLDPAVG